MVRRRPDLRDILAYRILDPPPKTLNQRMAGGEQVIAGLGPSPQRLAQILARGGMQPLQSLAQVGIEGLHVAISIRSFQIEDLDEFIVAVQHSVAAIPQKAPTGSLHGQSQLVVTVQRK